MSWDPQTKKEKDFKLLHLQDVMANGGPTIGQGSGGIPTLGGQLGPNGSPTPGAFPRPRRSADSESFWRCIGQANPGGIQAQANPQSPDNTDPSNSGSSDSGANSGNNANSNGPNGTSPSAGGPTSGGQPLTGQVFGGGGPILGVGSTNKKLKTIREFNKKSKYTDWYFIYDASADRRGVLLVGPWQPLVSIAGGSGVGQPIGTGPAGTQPVTNQSPTPTPSPNPQSSPFPQSPPDNPPNN